MRYLITGVAGFIGSSIADSLLADGHEVVGIDCFTDYYDGRLKRSNVAGAREHSGFELLELDLAKDELPARAIEVDGVFHQAAQAGVRASWGSEFATYTDCNVLATQRLLEAIVRRGEARPRVIYASSSSVYGNAETRPTREVALPSPISPYGVTKLAAEHLHATYFHNYGLPGAALRYFTVFGERQRPDMAFHRFCRAAVEGSKITIYGDGTQSRDFTYIADAVAANRAAMDSTIPWNIYNIGGGATITVREVLELLGTLAGTELDVDYVDTQKGDVRHTSADTSRAREAIGYDPTVSVEDGLRREIAWMRDLVAANVLA